MISLVCFLQSKLYPTVGLQTPGEEVDANFGQEPFKFDIDDMFKELRASTKASILSFPLPEDQGDWTILLNKYTNRINDFFFELPLTKFLAIFFF